MGSWNCKPFGNDTALDWLSELECALDDGCCSAALNKILQSGAALDSDECQEAIAAAAILEASRRHPISGIPKNARAWIVEHGFSASPELLKSAVQAVELIAEKSELRELWQESSSYKAWQKEMAALLTALRSALAKPSIKKKLKPPNSRLGLEKLIAKISPGAQTPLREKLRARLAQLPDVNAPLPRTLAQPPLHLLAAQGLMPEAELLIQRGAKVNHKTSLGRTALKEACFKGHVEMVELLLDRGAELFEQVELDAQSGNSLLRSEKPTVAWKFSGALVYAIHSDSVQTVEILVRHGADLNQKDLNRETLLHLAAREGQVRLIEYLVTKGLEVNAKTDIGETPLQWAVRANRLAAAKRLLELGADPNSHDKYGENAFDSVNTPEMAKVFQRES
jgi:hypothetical protein